MTTWNTYIKDDKEYFWRTAGHRGGKTIIVTDAMTGERSEVRFNIGYMAIDPIDEVPTLIKQLDKHYTM